MDKQLKNAVLVGRTASKLNADGTCSYTTVDGWVSDEELEQLFLDEYGSLPECIDNHYKCGNNNIIVDNETGEATELGE